MEGLTALAATFICHTAVEGTGLSLQEKGNSRGGGKSIFSGRSLTCREKNQERLPNYFKKRDSTKKGGLKIFYRKIPSQSVKF